MWLLIMLKFTKKQGFTHSLEDAFLEKLQGGQIDTPRWGLKLNGSWKMYGLS